LGVEPQHERLAGEVGEAARIALVVEHGEVGSGRTDGQHGRCGLWGGTRRFYRKAPRMETAGFDASVRPKPSAERACRPRRSRRPRHVVAPAAVLAGRMHAAPTPTLRPTEHLVGLQVAFDELEHAARGLSGRIAVEAFAHVVAVADEQVHLLLE